MVNHSVEHIGQAKHDFIRCVLDCTMFNSEGAAPEPLKSSTVNLRSTLTVFLIPVATALGHQRCFAVPLVLLCGFSLLSEKALKDTPVDNIRWVRLLQNVDRRSRLLTASHEATVLLRILF